MSIFKKTCLLLVIILGIFTMMGSVYAQNWGEDPSSIDVSNVNVGDKVKLSEHYTHHVNKSFFCVCRNQWFKGGSYQAIAKITINGNYSSDENRSDLKNRWNGIIAYDLGLSNGHPGFMGGGNTAQYQIYKDIKSWINNVGIHHVSSLNGFASGANDYRYKKSIYNDACNYADSLNKDPLKNNTDKSKIKVLSYDKDNKEYLRIGPFNYTFRDKITKIELSENNNKTITPNLFGVFSGTDFKEINVSEIKSDKNFYILIPADSGLSVINSIKVYESHKVKSATIVFWRNQFNIAAINWQNLIQFRKSEVNEPAEDNWNPNIELLGNLKITKKDFDDNNNISNVTFKISNEKGKYVKRDSNNKITYVDEENATIFKTNGNGEITIEKLSVGKYTITEIKNNNATYGGETGEIDTKYIYYNTDTNSNKEQVKNGKITINVKASTENYTNLFIYNKKRFIDISGKVWEDKVGGKNRELDDVLHTEDYQIGKETYEGNDELKSGVTVLLKDKNGNIIQQTTTGTNGDYIFKNVLISELENYYVEFVYDGLTYTSVKALVGNDSSINSKAGEVVSERKTLNAGFKEITNNGSITDRNHGKANGEPTRTLTYVNDENKWISTFESANPDTNLTANTDVASFKLKDQVGNAVSGKNGALEIPNVNLGLVQREQPNISIKNDLTSVKVQVNGYGNTYTKSSDGTNYGTKSDFIEQDKETNEFYTNLTAKFEKNSGSYTRELYPSDIQFSSNLAAGEDAKKLKVYATYSITVNNYSNSLSVSVPEIVDYYDKNYEIIANGTEFPGGAINGLEIDSVNNEKYNGNTSITSAPGTEVNEYKTAYIRVGDNIKIEASKSLVINVTYRVNDETVKKVLGDGDKSLNTVTEINAYTTYYSKAIEGCAAGDIYAGVDRNSAPGNATPGKIETYEDDTDRAPSFILTAKGARQIEGTVFEDSTGSEELQSGQERKGNGIYDNNENTVNQVTVELLNKDGSLATYYPNAVSDDGQTPDKDVLNLPGTTEALITNNYGCYLFKGIEPDEYLIKFTYSNGKTKICDVNGTEVKNITVQNYKSTIITSNKIREAFDNGNNNWYTQEADMRYSDARDDYTVRTQIDDELKVIDETTTPTITSIYATTPNFVIPMEFDSIITSSNNNTFIHRISNIDFGIVERPRPDVTIEKEVTHIKVTLPNGQVLIDGDPRGNLDYVSVTKNNNKIEEIYITIDNELIYGSQVEIEYGLTVTNSSELDYSTKEYYYYGNKGDIPVTMTKATIVDYVDSDIMLKAGQEGTWNVLDIADKGYNWNLTPEQEQELLNKFSTVVKAEPIDGDKELKPNESSTTYIMVEKLLSTEDTELVYENNGEVVRIEKTGGGLLYKEIPVGDSAPPVVIVPPTGSTNHNVMYAIIATASLAVLGIGTYGVRRFLKK